MYSWEHKHRMHGYRRGFRFPWVALILFFAFITLATGNWHHWRFFGWPFLFALPLICVAPFILALWFTASRLKRWRHEFGEYHGEGQRKRNDMFDSLFEAEKPKRDEKLKRGDASDNDIFYV